MNFALTVSNSKMVATGSPVELGEADIEALSQGRDLEREGEEREKMCSHAYLCVSVDVPEVQPPLSIHTGKHGRMGGAPLHIVHIVTVALKGAKWRTSLALRAVKVELAGSGWSQGTHCELLLIL